MFAVIAREYEVPMPKSCWSLLWYGSQPALGQQRGLVGLQDLLGRGPVVMCDSKT